MGGKVSFHGERENLMLKDVIKYHFPAFSQKCELNEEDIMEMDR